MPLPANALKCHWLLILLLMPTAPAWATTQCPAEFGPKAPSVNLLGWCVVAAGIALGVALLALSITRLRRLRRPARVAVITLAMLGMLLVWLMGFALAFSLFFFAC